MIKKLPLAERYWGEKLEKIYLEFVGMEEGNVFQRRLILYMCSFLLFLNFSLQVDVLSLFFDIKDYSFLFFYKFSLQMVSGQ